MVGKTERKFRPFRATTEYGRPVRLIHVKEFLVSPFDPAARSLNLEFVQTEGGEVLHIQAKGVYVSVVDGTVYNSDDPNAPAPESKAQSADPGASDKPPGT